MKDSEFLEIDGSFGEGGGAGVSRWGTKRSIPEKPGFPAQENWGVQEITNNSVVILRVPNDPDNPIPMEYEQSPLAAISLWCRERGLNPLCIMLPEGQGLDILSEEDMAAHGWYRGE